MTLNDRVSGRPISEAVDANGKIRIKALADGALTAKGIYGCYLGYDGWHVTTLSSVTVAASASTHFYAGRWKVGIAPKAATASGDEVWMQVGGVCSGTIAAATTLALGEFVEVSNSACVLGAATSAIPQFNTFAICYTASTSTSVELMMLNRFVISRA
jgi:hypothetical protein